MQAAYSTTIWSAEANYLGTSVFDKFILLAGFRAIQLHDHLSLLSQTTSVGRPRPVRSADPQRNVRRPDRDDVPAEPRSVYVRNHCQVGLLQRPRQHAELRGRHGNGRHPRHVGSSSNAAAFVQEFSANATYHFTSAFAIRLGYQLMWFDNMALAANNVDLSNLAATSGDHLPWPEPVPVRHEPGPGSQVLRRATKHECLSPFGARSR